MTEHEKSCLFCPFAAEEHGGQVAHLPKDTEPVPLSDPSRCWWLWATFPVRWYTFWQNPMSAQFYQDVDIEQLEEEFGLPFGNDAVRKAYELELFTERECEQLEHWIRDEFPEAVSISRRQVEVLPMPNSIYPTGWLPVGHSEAHIPFFALESYNLPFRANAFAKWRAR